MNIEKIKDYICNKMQKYDVEFNKQIELEHNNDVVEILATIYEALGEQEFYSFCDSHLKGTWLGFEDDFYFHDWLFTMTFFGEYLVLKNKILPRVLFDFALREQYKDSHPYYDYEEIETIDGPIIIFADITNLEYPKDFQMTKFLIDDEIQVDKTLLKFLK